MKGKTQEDLEKVVAGLRMELAAYKSWFLPIVIALGDEAMTDYNRASYLAVAAIKEVKKAGSA